MTSALIFTVEEQQYALDIASIRVVVPVLEMRQLAGTPDYVPGTIAYRGAIVPVLDVSRMLGKAPARNYYSTRIALVDLALPDGGSKLVGLMIEDAIQAVREMTGEWKPAGIATPAAPFLGGIAMQNGQSIQLVRVEELLTREAQQLLFAE